MLYIDIDWESLFTSIACSSKIFAVLCAHRLPTWLRYAVARVGAATATGNSESSIVDSGVVSSTTVRITVPVS